MTTIPKTEAEAIRLSDALVEELEEVLDRHAGMSMVVITMALGQVMTTALADMVEGHPEDLPVVLNALKGTFAMMQEAMTEAAAQAQHG